MSFNTKFPVFLIVFIATILLLYWLSYLLPFTNNAFVVANIRPVAANVSGYVTQLFVQNEQFVTKGQPILTVFQPPYQLAYNQAKSEVLEAKSNYLKLEKTLAKDNELLVQYQEIYEKINFQYHRLHDLYKYHAVSEIEVNNLLHDKNAAQAQVMAGKDQVAIDQQNLISQTHLIEALTAKMQNAKVNLNETIVKATKDGIIQNLYLSLGAPVEIRQPMFSFIDTDKMYIQANFNETDLRKVKPGTKVTIFPRMYFGDKIYHGIVISKNWAANRQTTNQRDQLQNVTNNADNWILLPQRFPVQIKITDYDPNNYPLSIGASAYVYLHTN